MSDTSDFELHSAPELLLKKTKKTKQPKSPTEEILDQEPKKTSTKVMIYEALTDLRKGTRKGSSLYAIKKHMTKKHGVDVEKINHIIKRRIKEGVESGIILQTKGIGASGSFRLAAVTKTEEKKSKPKKKEENTEKLTEKPKKITAKSETKPKTKTVTKENSKEEKQVVKKKTTVSKATKVTIKEQPKKKEGIIKGKVEKTKNQVAFSDTNATKKKAAMSKRKSIGSIIKTPKMRPKLKK